MSGLSLFPGVCFQKNRCREATTEISAGQNFATNAKKGSAPAPGVVFRALAESNRAHYLFGPLSPATVRTIAGGEAPPATPGAGVLPNAHRRRGGALACGNEYTAGTAGRGLARAFSPFGSFWAVTSGVARGWYGAGPLALRRHDRRCTCATPIHGPQSGLDRRLELFYINNKGWPRFRGAGLPRQAYDLRTFIEIRRRK